MEAPYREFSVDEDLVVGTVPSEWSEPLEPLEDLSGGMIVFLRLRSLKNGIVTAGASWPMQNQDLMRVQDPEWQEHWCD